MSLTSLEWGKEMLVKSHEVSERENIQWLPYTLVTKLCVPRVHSDICLTYTCISIGWTSKIPHPPIDLCKYPNCQSSSLKIAWFNKILPLNKFKDKTYDVLNEISLIVSGIWILVPFPVGDAVRRVLGSMSLEGSSESLKTHTISSLLALLFPCGSKCEPSISCSCHVDPTLLYHIL